MLYDLVEQTCEIHADKTALLFNKEKYTFDQLKKLTSDLASSFIHLNIKPGDKIAFFLTNRPEAILCFLAGFKVGATVLPLNQFFNSQQLQSILHEAKPKILIIEKNLLPELVNIPSDVLADIDCYVTDSHDSSLEMKLFATLLEPVARVEFFPAIPSDTLATISYTSGTTGAPKGVMHTQEQLYQFLVNHAHHVQYATSDRVLAYVPIAFGYSFSNQILPSLYSGSSISLVPAGNWVKIINTIQDEQVTLIYVGPTTFVNWLNILQNRSAFYHQLRAVVSAGDAMPIALHKRVKELLNITIYEGIGMTETWLYALNPLNEKAKVGSMGPPCPGIEIKIVSDHGQTLPNGTVGQIAVKGHSVMQDYCSAGNAFINGWFYTGDCGYLDDDGYLYFSGRKDLLIQKNGVSVFPHEIEFALYEYPAILEAGVTSQLNAFDEEEILAYVSLKSTTMPVTKADIFRHLKNYLPAEKHPDEIIMLSQLPKGVTGKIDRKLLRNIPKNIGAECLS
jgi:long-chain acyl-CoA synthetase